MTEIIESDIQATKDRIAKDSIRKLKEALEGQKAYRGRKAKKNMDKKNRKCVHSMMATAKNLHKDAAERSEKIEAENQAKKEEARKRRAATAKPRPKKKKPGQAKKN